MLNIRTVDVESDKADLLEFHVVGNYESDSPWARQVSFEQYRKEWLANTPQTEEFLSHLAESLQDSRTIAEIWEADTAPIGFLWVTFDEIVGWNLTVAEVRDLELAAGHRQRGIGSNMLVYAEELSRQRGAGLLQSGTGVDNVASQELHAKMGLEIYHVDYEKRLAEDSQAPG